MESILPCPPAEPPPVGVQSSGRTAGDDLHLMRRIAAKDADAAGELARDHRDGMYRLAYSLLGDPDEAADSAQSAILRAIASAGKFDGRAPLRNWLLQIVLREAQKLHRRQRWTSLLPDRRDPREPYAQIDANDALRRAMARLTPPLKEAFVLLYVEELTITEAATLLSLPEGTVKSRSHAARAALRRALENP